MSRRAAREKALQALYEVEVGGAGLMEALEHAVGENQLAGESLEFAKTLLTGAWENRKASDGLIVKYARDWHIDRLAVIDRNIFRLAIFEMTGLPDIPHEVSINEAVELAKIYSTQRSTSFINAILDSISKEIKGENKA